ncbi:MAG: fimbria major subunit [Proteiniphilum sp.]|jgi:hypothetical protein|nr:fimbria major subunit [Proteiniphilum sp.]
MKTTKLIAGLILCGGIFSACNNEDGPEPKIATGEPAALTISIATPTTYALTGAEEAGVGNENLVTKVELYVFDDAGEPDPKVGGDGYFTADIATGVTTYKWTVVVTGGDKKIVAVVNSDLGALPTGDTYDDLIAKLSAAEFKASGADYNSRTIPATGFEMSGKAESTVVPGVPSSANSVQIRVSRLVSKINAPVFTDVAGVNTAVDLTTEEIEELWGEGTTVTLPDVSFKGLGYALANGIKKSTVIFVGRADGDDTTPSTRPWTAWTWPVGKEYLNSTFAADGSYTNNYSGQGSGTDWILNGTVDGQKHVYAYENKPKTITVNGQTGFAPKNVYAFVVKGEFIVDGDEANANGENQIRYWRVDLVRNNNYHILRNNSYHVYLKTITSIGYATPQEAEETPDIIPEETDSSAEIQVIVNPWRVNQYEGEV